MYNNYSEQELKEISETIKAIIKVSKRIHDRIENGGSHNMSENEIPIHEHSFASKKRKYNYDKHENDYFNKYNCENHNDEHFYTINNLNSKSNNKVTLDDVINKAIYMQDDNKKENIKKNNTFNEKNSHREYQNSAINKIYQKLNKVQEENKEKMLWCEQDLAYFQRKYFETNIYDPYDLPEVLIRFESYLANNFYYYMDFWTRDEDCEPISINEENQKLFQDVLEKTRNVMVEIVNDESYLSNVKRTLRYDLSPTFLRVFTAMCKMLKSDMMSNY